MWENLRLNAEEEEIVGIDGKGVATVMEKGDRSLIGKIWAERQINKAVVQSTMGKIWRISKPAEFTEMGRNIFMITFANHADLKRVEEGRPWLFDGSIFVMNAFEGYTPLSEMQFDVAALWV
ncbi:unnamed protein product [Fraxinus pennsylvanica]|uniref:DUF4283 domain-containing protein n=1 Tax=Fraxinus pennsylvanica TaxID=56036 RepID=A0AAD2E7X9_9LAMI|nr:unnamed protein product [Fraxinus pennsylvanica]